MKRALLVVDLQNDFYEDGALPVPEASRINDRVNRLMEEGDYEVIIASQDWHPAEHKSYAVNMGEKPYTPFDNGQGIGPVLWPVHCKQETRGADFHPAIKTQYFNYIIRKGTNPKVDSYSAFRENNGKELGLAELLKGLGVEEVDVCGLALDYCVKFTALDAAAKGFKTNLILEASKGVGAGENDIELALSSLKDSGVTIK